MQILKENFPKKMRQLQDQISENLKRLDPQIKCQEDAWERTDFVGNKGGGGLTRSFVSDGNLFENAGVNFSLVHGKIDPQFGQQLMGKSDTFWASGTSLIIHPKNPKVPSFHANFRMIQNGDKIWFGGGADLTPYYPYKEDFHYFHSTWSKAFGDDQKKYQEMKKTCDEYFVNKHRGNEMRGVGGIFFDHYNSGDLEEDFSFVSRLADTLVPAYFPLVEKRMKESWTEEDENFQLHRRGRYVEFNLLYDRGTLFGLRTGGRIPSILISLPGRCKFSYDYQPKSGSPHEEMMNYYFPHPWGV